MKILSRDSEGEFRELEVNRVVISEGDLSLEVTESRSIRDLSPEITVYLVSRGLEIRVRPDGSVNVANIAGIEVTSPITVRGRP